MKTMEKKRKNEIISILKHLGIIMLNVLSTPIQMVLLMIEISMLLTIAIPIWCYIKHGTPFLVSHMIWSTKPKPKVEKGECPAIRYNNGFASFKPGYNLRCWYWFAETKYVHP
jgi:hypothetical protein